MSKLLGPYALSASSVAPFNVEWDQTSTAPIGVDLENISGLLLEVDVAGQPYWLNPWTAKYFQVPQNSGYVQIVPHADISPAASDPLKLAAILYQIGDSPPQIQERSLTGIAIAASISIVQEEIITSQVMTVPATGTSVVPINVPVGVQSLLVAINPNGGSLPNVLQVQSLSGASQHGGYVVPATGNGSGATAIDVLPGNQNLLIGNPNNASSVPIRLTVIGFGLPAAMVMPNTDIRGQVAETPASVLTTNTATGILVPDLTNLWSGFLKARIRNLNIITSSATGGAFATLTGSHSGNIYGNFEIGASGATFFTPPFDMEIPEGLKVSSSIAAGTTRFSCTYALLPTNC